MRIVLVDPPGSALYHYFKDGELKSDGGSSITEGIGTGRVTANLEGAPIDDALRITDAETMRFVYRLLREEGLLLGSTLGNQRGGGGDVCEADGPGHTIVTGAVRRRREVSIATVQPSMDQGARLHRGDRLSEVIADWRSFATRSRPRAHAEPASEECSATTSPTTRSAGDCDPPGRSLRAMVASVATTHLLLRRRALRDEGGRERSAGAPCCQQLARRCDPGARDPCRTRR